MLRRAWIAIRLIVLVLLAAQAVYYALSFGRESRFLREQVVSKVVLSTDPARTLTQALNLAFLIPPRSDTMVGFESNHPLMRLLHPSATHTYLYGGGSAMRARLLVVLLRDLGIRAHKLYVYDQRARPGLDDSPHGRVRVTVEASIDDRWVVADPVFNLVFPMPDGQLAGVEDLRRDPELLHQGMARADQRYSPWLNDRYMYDDVRRFPWFTVRGLGEATYQQLTRFFPKAKVDWITLPYILEEPQLVIAILSVLLMIPIAATFAPAGRRG